MQDGEDGREGLLAAQAVWQGQEAVDDVFEILQVGSLPALVPDVLFDVALKGSNLLSMPLTLLQQPLPEAPGCGLSSSLCPHLLLRYVDPHPPSPV